MGALAPDRQPSTVPDALITTDLGLSADVLADLAPQISFHLIVGVDKTANGGGFLLGEIPTLVPGSILMWSQMSSARVRPTPKM